MKAFLRLLHVAAITASVQAAPTFSKPVKSDAVRAAAACSGPVTGNVTAYWMDQLDHDGPAGGFAPFAVNHPFRQSSDTQQLIDTG